MKKSNKIIIVDDHEFFRKNFKDSVNSLDGMDVIGEASNGQEFLELLNTKNPDLVFIDVKMPVMNGITAISIALRNNHLLKCIALTMHKERDYVIKLIESGVKGILFKSASFDEIEIAIKTVLDDEMYFTKEIKKVLNK